MSRVNLAIKPIEELNVKIKTNIVELKTKDRKLLGEIVENPDKATKAIVRDSGHDPEKIDAAFKSLAIAVGKDLKAHGLDLRFIVQKLKRILKSEKVILVKEKVYDQKHQVCGEVHKALIVGPDHELHLKTLERLMKVAMYTPAARKKQVNPKETEDKTDALAELSAREEIQTASMDVELEIVDDQ